MAKINFLLLLSATTQLHQALILKTPFVQRLTVAGTYLICWAAGVEGVLCETFENIIPRELYVDADVLRSYILLTTDMLVSSWVSGLSSPLILFLQQCFYEGGPQLCLQSRGRLGDKNRKSLTTNCPPRDQLSHMNWACLYKHLPPVFTASTHFCFTTSKLLGRLFGFT